jgi:tetratricopeptide (TPR) repeat protein
MADTLITRLSNIRSIAVRPTSAVLRYNAADRDPVAAGRTLAVEAVLEGSIQRADDRVRVTLRLLNVRDGSPLWADKFDAKLTDILLVQDSISEHVARALTLNLTGEEKQQITKRHTRSQEAYALYVEGRYHWNKRKMDMSRAISYFQQAIEKDPDFALAYVGLADTLAMNGPPSEASFAISKAIEMDDSLGEAHASLGFIKMFHRWQWADAEREFKRAIELNPGYATAHQWYAICLAITGRIEEAKAEMRRALDIDPTSPNMNADMGQLLYFERDYDGAIAYCRKALETDPDFFFAHGYLFDIYMKKGMYDQAIESYFESVRTSFSDSAKRSLSDVKAQYMGVYRNTGIRGFLQGFIKENKNVASPYYSAWGAARCYALLDEREQALSWLEKACESHLFLVPFIAVDPIFDQLRPEPRFQSLLRRMGLKEG